MVLNWFYGSIIFMHCMWMIESTDPCTDHFVDTDEQRSTAFIVPAGSLSRAGDRTGFTAGWYRFTSGAGGTMPTTCPEKRACGVEGSIWLKGNHPSAVGEVKAMRACVRVNNICCTRNAFDVDVKKCLEGGKHYFVYKLRPAPGYQMRYCAGSEKRCLKGETSVTGFTPGCTSNYPKLRSDPVVSVDVKDFRLRFKCEINPKDNGEYVRHEVTWYEGTPEKKLNQTKILIGGETEAYLWNNNSFNDLPTFSLGNNIYCKVASYYEDELNTTGKFTRNSKPFFAGFEINPKFIDITEKDKPAKITVKTTVPIVCQDGSTNCQVLFEIAQTNIEDALVSWCTLNFKPGPAGETRELEVVAKRDFVDDGDQSMFIKFNVPAHINPVDWSYYGNITDVQVVTRNVATARCTSISDPHITTFDGLHYHNFDLGDYILVDSKTRLFKVHVRTFQCQYASCNCGVAVREGDDVIVVDMCRDRVPRARFASTVEPQKGTTIERSKIGNIFVMNFPSGAYVKFHAKPTMAAIEIQLPSDDYGNTTGLCGTYDRNKNNDIKARDGTLYTNVGMYDYAPKGFIESWKIGAGESLFYYKGGERKCQAERIKKYCTCNGEDSQKKKEVNCNYDGYSQRPKYKQGSSEWKKLDFPGAEHCGKRRKRRSLDTNVVVLPDDGDVSVYDYNPTYKSTPLSNFPTKSGITENKAKTVCTNAITNSSAGKTCMKTIQGFSIADYIEQCTMDIRFLDNMKIATESAVDAMAGSCEEITLREVQIYWQNDSNGVLEPPTTIGNSICPNDCSGNGACVNATCVCGKGFISSDCSMLEGEPPVLINIPFDGLCDIRKQDCIRTRVVGYNFLDSNKLACRTTEVIISDKPVQLTQKIDEVESQLLSFAELSCSLPRIPVIINGDIDRSPGKPAGGFYIELSNDGTTFSKNKTLLIVYDSKCMECPTNLPDDERICKWKANSCKINNYCFVNDDPNPKNWCQVCDPSRSNSSFVERLKNDPPVFKASAPTLNIFKGQIWRYEIPVSDPEKQLLKYDFIGDSHGMKISSAGIITWQPTRSNMTYTYTVKATDRCNKSAQQTFRVKTWPCQCEGENRGYCDWQGAKSICKCPDGCAGPKCRDPTFGRTCEIRFEKRKDDLAEKRKDDNPSSKTTNVAVVVVIVLIAIVLLVVGFIIYKLKKNKRGKFKISSSYDTLKILPSEVVQLTKQYYI